MGEEVVRHDEAARLEFPPDELEVALVVSVLRVEEDDVEDIFDRGKKLDRITLQKLN